LWQPASVHVFADESERRGYLIAAAFVAPERLPAYRAAMRALLLRGERRIHFKSEKDPRRRLILSRLVDLDVVARVYHTAKEGEVARGQLLELMAMDLAEVRATRLILDARDQISNARDRTVIAKTEAAQKGLAYDHLHSSSEPILWISDAIAWSYGAGMDWRRRASRIVERTVRLDVRSN